MYLKSLNSFSFFFFFAVKMTSWRFLSSTMDITINNFTMIYLSFRLLVFSSMSSKRKNFLSDMIKAVKLVGMVNASQVQWYHWVFFLQDLACMVREPKGSSFQRLLDLIPVQSTSSMLLRLQTIQQELLTSMLLPSSFCLLLVTLWGFQVVVFV